MKHLFKVLQLIGETQKEILLARREFLKNDTKTYARRMDNTYKVFKMLNSCRLYLKEAMKNENST